MSLFDNLGTIFTGVFGDGAEYTIETAGGARVVTGIFREQDQILLPGEEFEGIVTTTPTLRIDRADADGIADGDRVTIDGVPYEIRAVLDDGRAMVTLRLEAV
jgi:hypothetical protein